MFLEICRVLEIAVVDRPRRTRRATSASRPVGSGWVAGGRRRVQQESLPRPGRQVGPEPGDGCGLRRGEAKPAVLTVQTQVPPAPSVQDKGCPELVAQPDRAHDVAVALAGEPVVAGGVIEPADMPAADCERGEPVHVTPAELVVQEPGGSLVQRRLTICGGEEQRFRVRGGHERGIHRQHRTQGCQHRIAEGAHLQAPVADADNLSFRPTGPRMLIHDVTVLPPATAENPNLLGWCCQYRGRSLGP